MTESYDPKLEDSALSEMLVGVANDEKQYVGDEGTHEGRTKSPLTLGVTDKGLVVIDNQMVAKGDGVSALGDASMAIKTCIVSDRINASLDKSIPQHVIEIEKFSS